MCIRRLGTVWLQNELLIYELGAKQVEKETDFKRFFDVNCHFGGRAVEKDCHVML